MPLTNAEKQKRARDKRNATLVRYEAALREIEGGSCVFDWADQPHEQMQERARQALAPTTSQERLR